MATNATAGGSVGFVGRALAEAGVPYAAALGSAITFVVVFVLVYLAGRLTVSPLLSRVMAARDLDAHARRPLQKLTKLAIGFVAVAVAFGLADYGDFLQSLATIAAAATLAIGFAMQDVMKNFAAGLFIFTDRPFRIGDWIEWDGHKGTVEDISLRVSRVRTFDNELLTVPNSQLTDGVIKNPVDADKLRVTVDFGIGYDDDVATARLVILDEAEAHAEIMLDPAPSVRLVEMGDSAVGLQSRVWIADPSRSDVVRIKGEYVEAVMDRFDEEGVEIPYPNVTVGGGLEVTNVEALDD
jgi:small conductance mechanosensitive channel